MQKNRDLSFDAFRGVAIIAIVATHVTSGSLADNGYLIAYHQLFHFGVPAFLFISGYWLSLKPINSLKDYELFLRKRLSRILIPYLVWSIVIIGYETIITADYNISLITYKLLTGRAIMPYYYVILTAQFYILTPLLQYLNRKPHGLVVILLFNCISLLAIYLSRAFNIFGFIPIWRPFYTWIIFYQLGLWIGSREIKKIITPIINIYIIPALILSLLILEAETMFLLTKSDNLEFSSNSIKYSSFLYSICVIFGFLCIREKLECWPKFLINLGRYSFGVLLIHIPILRMVFKMVPDNNSIFLFQLVYHVIAVLVIILICYVIINLTRKILPKTFCTKILGF